MLDVGCSAFKEAPMLRLISLLGIVVFLLLAWLLSNNRRLFPWRTVLWGLALQFFFALFILKTPIGARLFCGRAGRLVEQLNSSAYQGRRTGFRPAGAPGSVAAARSAPEHGCRSSPSAISATIIFISSLSSLLYHWGVLQRVVAAYGVGDAKGHAHQRQREPGGREQYLPRPDRGGAGDQAVPREDDPERNDGA